MLGISASDIPGYEDYDLLAAIYRANYCPIPDSVCKDSGLGDFVNNKVEFGKVMWSIAKTFRKGTDWMAECDMDVTSEGI